MLDSHEVDSVVRKIWGICGSDSCLAESGPRADDKTMHTNDREAVCASVILWKNQSKA
jgi:hypothetical protein